MADTQKVYIVIPAYNEEKHLSEVIRGVRTYCRNIIVVDDGSGDKTNSIAISLNVILITLPINRGKGYALRVGFNHAISIGATKIITLDSDGQHNPKHLPSFIKSLDSYDVAIGVRKGFHPIPFVRKLGNRAASYLVYLLYGIFVQDLLCGFRGMTSRAYEKLRWQSVGYGVETEMIARIGTTKLKYTQIEIENIYIDQFKGVTLLDAARVFLSIPTFGINHK